MYNNATTIDSEIYSGIFSTLEMREVWSGRSRIQRYLDVEKAISLTQGRLGVIRNSTEHIGYHPHERARALVIGHVVG